jgi:hypothetical protein
MVNQLNKVENCYDRIKLSRNDFKIYKVLLKYTSCIIRVFLGTRIRTSCGCHYGGVEYYNIVSG